MSCVLKLNKTVIDINGLQLPMGEYIFNIDKLNDFFISGEIKLKETNESISTYEFKNNDFIALLINSQKINSGVINKYQEEEQANKCCSICLNDIIDNRYILGCAHHFHENCILRWLENSNSCPICRCTVEDNICLTENIVLRTPSPRRIRTPQVTPLNQRRRRIATTPLRRRRRRATTPIRRRRGNNTTRNTVIVPDENIPRRSRRIATREREYSQMFSSTNIINLLQD
uniref:RING-type domain-containing protein n=1 Tax=viral metagenome TaxID=1070528 RepID=A0A6C0BZ28_9ZZZZ